MDRRLADWLNESEALLAKANPEERLAVTMALVAEVAMNSSVQGTAVQLTERKAYKNALAQHLVRAIGQFFEERAK